jgi:hypothetical protein
MVSLERSGAFAAQLAAVAHRQHVVAAVAPRGGGGRA